jgi:hypothetical protein
MFSVIVQCSLEYEMMGKGQQPSNPKFTQQFSYTTNNITYTKMCWFDYFSIMNFIINVDTSKTQN